MKAEGLLNIDSPWNRKGPGLPRSEQNRANSPAASSPGASPWASQAQLTWGMTGGMVTKVLAGLVPRALTNNLIQHLTVARQQLPILCSV